MKTESYWLPVIVAVIALGVLAFEHSSTAYVQAATADDIAWRTLVVLFAIYVLAAVLSLPGAFVLSLAAGVAFDFLPAVLLVSFASSIGATLAFLVARYLLRDTVQRKFGARLHAIDQGIEKDGPFYLFALRMAPVLPFFLVNALMGLTRLRTLTFYLVSQASMLPGTIVYVNAGNQIGKIDNLGDIFTPAFLVSFTLLGMFPLAARKFVARMKAARTCKVSSKPARRRFQRKHANTLR